jgi:prophage regulatory protein
MLDILRLLRRDADLLTLGELVREREVAAREIERLTSELARLRETAEARSLPPRPSPIRTVAPTAVATNRSEPKGALLRLSDVSALVGLGRSTLYARIADGTFPRAVRVSERSVRWRTTDVNAWLESLAENQSSARISHQQLGRRQKARQE